jgi:hypothetical protein
MATRLRDLEAHMRTDAGQVVINDIWRVIIGAQALYGICKELQMNFNQPRGSQICSLDYHSPVQTGSARGQQKHPFSIYRKSF